MSLLTPQLEDTVCLARSKYKMLPITEMWLKSSWDARSLVMEGSLLPGVKRSIIFLGLFFLVGALVTLTCSTGLAGVGVASYLPPAMHQGSSE